MNPQEFSYGQVKGKVLTFDFENPVVVPPRKIKFCGKCQCYHELGFFWRHHGKIKGCGFHFIKGLIKGTGAKDGVRG